jgi:hypothetical protein
VRADSQFVYIREGAKSGDRVVMTALETPVNGATVRTTGDMSGDTSIFSGEVE